MIYFPKLVNKKEFVNYVKKYSKEQIYELIISYLIFDYSTDELDSRVLNLESSNSDSSKILKYFGMRKEHKGLYNEVSYEKIIESLNESEYNPKTIIEIIKNNFKKNKRSNLIINESESDVLEYNWIDDIDLINLRKIKVRNLAKQKKFRTKLLQEFHAKCAICGISEEKLLIASHIVPFYILKDDIKKAFDINNGLLLCVLHDALFEHGRYISIDYNKGLILSKRYIGDSDKDFFNLRNNKLENIFLTVERKKYLFDHNTMFYEEE